MIYLTTSLILGFLTVLIGTPYAKRYLVASGIFAVDQQKEDTPKIATSGGIAVLFGFIIAVTSYLGFASFFNTTSFAVNEVLAALSAVTIITLIGVIDDIHINLKVIVEEELDIKSGEFELDIHEELEQETPYQKYLGRFTGSKEKESSQEMIREGLSQVPKMFFVLPAALPLIAVGAGSWQMYFPVIGLVDWGILYPLVLLPVGLLFVSNVVNMLAGTNGLAAAMSLVASTALGIFGYLNGSMDAVLIAFSLSACLLAFLKYNFYPASILPGDSLTYLAGAAMFSTIVIGDMEKFGVLIFTPWIAEFFLKARSGFKAHSWGIFENGRLRPQHDKNYSLTHPLMRRGFTESQITLTLAGVETLICVTALFLFRAGLL